MVGPDSSVVVAVTSSALLGSVIAIVSSTAWHTVPSIVTLTEYTPEDKLANVLDVTAVSVCTSETPSFQTKVKVALGLASELAVTVPEPVVSPVQSTSVTFVIAISASHVLTHSITILWVIVQLLASVTVTLCVPSDNPVTEAVVALPADALHK